MEPFPDFGPQMLTYKPSLAKSGYLSVHFSQGSAEPVDHTHIRDRVSLGALG
jgi:hypothetical protein